MKKNLAEKFDHLPQDFDRIVIWNGIEKPKKAFLLRTYFGRILFVFVGLTALFLLYNQLDKISQRNEKMIFSKAFQPTEDHLIAVKKNDPYISKRNEFEHEKQRDKASGGPKTLSYSQQVAGVRLEERSTNTNREFEQIDVNNQNNNQALVTIGKSKGIRGMSMKVPKELNTDLKKEGENLFLTSENAFPDLPLRKKHSLSLRIGVGKHASDFYSLEGSAADWRERLEESQIDYLIGLRFEHELERNILFSLSTTYQLFKDKINTSYLVDSLGQGGQIEYRLFNHYHVFTAHAELGKRFEQKEFFWDVMGGLGVKIRQFSEVDFITGEGELASDILIENMYSNSNDAFLSAQSAIGRYMSDRLFIRVGVQAYAPFDLTRAQAPVRHRVFPVSSFLEAGMRF